MAGFLVPSNQLNGELPMSKATKELHSEIKRPLSIIFTALLAFIGGSIFPGGLIVILVFTGLNQYIFHIPDVINNNLFIGLLALGLFAALYSIISDITENLDIHKRVIIEILNDNQAIREYLAKK